MTDAISRQAVIEMLDETKRIARQNIDGTVLMTFERVLDSLVNITNALPTIQPEPLTDKEQRIFLAAIERERKVCKEVDDHFDGDVSLTKVCSEIERKVKAALWS